MIGSENVSLQADVPSQSLKWQGKLQLDKEIAFLESAIAFQENSLSLNAEFGEDSWLPQRASWNADSWQIASEDFGLDILYSDFRFDFDGSWQNGAFDAAGIGIAQATNNPELQPLNFDSSLSGNLDTINIDRFSINAPGLKAEMEDPVSFDIADNRLDGNLLFDINFDLALLKIEDLSGILAGSLQLESNEQGKPLGRFDLKGENIKYQDHSIQTLDLHTDLDWPFLAVRQADANFNSSSNIRLSGEFNLEERSSDSVSIEGKLDSPFIEPFLPEGISLKELEFEAAVHGPFSEPIHSGRFEFLELETTTVKPLSGEARWNGSLTTADSFVAEASNGLASFILEGNGGYQDSRIDLSIESLDLKLGGQSIAALASPAQLTVGTGESTNVSVSDFALSGSAGEISLIADARFPTSGKIDATISNLDTGNWHDPWIKDPASPAEIRSATLNLTWNEGPVTGQASLDAWLSVGEEPMFAKGNLQIYNQEIDLESFHISDTNGTLLTLDGKAPYSISSAVDGWISVDPKNELSLSIESNNSPTLLTALSELLPIALDSFELKGNLSGTVGNPSGDLTLAVQTLAGAGEHGLPSATIRFIGALDGSRVELSEVELGLLEEKFEANGSVQFPREILDYLLLQKPDPKWENTEFELDVPDSSVAPIAFFAPDFLRPDGGLSGKIQGSLSQGLDGSLSLQAVNTRPIFPFGSLRDISSELHFRDNEIELKSFSGKIGREPLNMSGKLNYENFAEPAFDLILSGTDLPMLRQPGLLQRGDLDLKVTRLGDEPAKISGSVNLKEGLFLLDTSVLVGGSSGGGRSASARPPYFAVDVPPVDDWKLDVALLGERFINLQTPAATGELSMDMMLQGTLAEPLLRGRIVYEEGAILFPFASFGIEQGLVEIRIDDPYTPILNVTGETRRLGYDLAVEITGSAFDPQIRFSSSPPLTSEQILLMVMAGENPTDSFSYSASQRASKIGSYLSKGLLGSGGSEGGIGSRLSISTGENLSQQGKETMEIEVLLDDQFQLVGEYDEYDAWNAGLRWRILGRDKAEEDGE